MTFVLPDGRRHDVEVSAGSTVLMAARRADFAIEGACGGSMACATCHIVVEDAFVDLVPPPSAEEEDMLDLAAEVQANSRLGCQVRLTPALDGLTVAVPRSTLLGWS